MNCECLDKIEKKALDNFRETNQFKKPIKSIDIGPLAFSINDTGLKTLTVSHLEVGLEGRKSKVKVILAHTFCPFCGERIRKEGGAA